MSGIFVDNGHTYLLNGWLGGSTLASMYIGLMTDGSYTSDNLTTTDLQLGAEITEVTGTGYTRQELSKNTWTVADSQGSYSEITFTVGSGGWNAVKGYFLSESLNGNDCIYCQSFDAGIQGDRSESDTVKITPTIEFRSFGE